MTMTDSSTGTIPTNPRERIRYWKSLPGFGQSNSNRRSRRRVRAVTSSSADSEKNSSCSSLSSILMVGLTRPIFQRASGKIQPAKCLYLGRSVVEILFKVGLNFARPNIREHCPKVLSLIHEKRNSEFIVSVVNLPVDPFKRRDEALRRQTVFFQAGLQHLVIGRQVDERKASSKRMVDKGQSSDPLCSSCRSNTRWREC